MKSERDLHDQLEAYLRKQGIPYGHERMDKGHSTKVGEPDFRCYRNGRVAFVEFKFGKGKLSPAQTERIKELGAAGCEVCVTTDLSEAIAHINAALGSREQMVVNVNAPPSDKLWLISSRDLGAVVVVRNSHGAMEYIRVAKDADFNLPRWSEQLEG